MAQASRGVLQMKKAEGGSKGIQRWLKRQQRRLSGKMLGIGDGANDVAMIQAAGVGIGIMGKEGRQVNTPPHPHTPPHPFPLVPTILHLLNSIFTPLDA